MNRNCCHILLWNSCFEYTMNERYSTECNTNLIELIFFLFFFEQTKLCILNPRIIKELLLQTCVTDLYRAMFISWNKCKHHGADKREQEHIKYTTNVNFSKITYDKSSRGSFLKDLGKITSIVYRKSVNKYKKFFIQ